MNAAEELGIDKDGVPFHVKKEVTSALRRLAPIGLSTDILWTANARTLRHVIEMRTAEGAEEELRLVFDTIARIMQAEAPGLFQGTSARQEDGAWVPARRRSSMRTCRRQGGPPSGPPTHYVPPLRRPSCSCAKLPAPGTPLAQASENANGRAARQGHGRARDPRRRWTGLSWASRLTLAMPSRTLPRPFDDARKERDWPRSARRSGR